MARASIALLLTMLVACSDAQTTSSPLADAGADGSLADSSAADASPTDAKPEKPDAAATNLGELSTARALMAAVTGPDKTVRVFGGLGSHPTDSTERYDGKANTWSDLAPSTSRRYGHAAGVDPAGIVYLVGGTEDGKTPTATASAYDSKTDEWTELPPLPEPRLGLGVAAIGGKVFAVGGRGPSGGASGATQVYDPAARKWTQAAAMPTARLAFATVVVGNKMYVVGGRDATDTPLASVEVYDPSADTWSTSEPLAVPRFWLGATVGTDGRIYAIGGISNVGFDNVVEAMRPGEPWKNLAPLPTPRAWLACATAPDGRILAIGGATATGSKASPPLSTMLAYDVQSDRWSGKTP